MKKTTIIYLAIITVIGFAIPVLALPTARYEQNILPFVDNTYDLGSTSPNLRWKNVYTNNLRVDGTCTGCGGGGGLGWASTTVPNSNSIYSTALSNVGIGTSSPYSMLSVAGQVVGQNFVATSTTATSTFSGYVSTSAFANTSMTSGSIPFYGAGGFQQQNNSNLFWDNTNARLGIGLTTPAQKLDVYINTSNQDYIQIQNAGAVGGAGVIAYNNDSSGYAAFTTYGTSYVDSNYRSNTALAAKNSFFIIANGSVASGGSGAIKFLTGGYTLSSQNRMTIDSGGNVGIGTASPGYNFEVTNGNGSFQAISVVSSYGNNAGAAILYDRKARGTVASPTTVQNNDYILSNVLAAYDGSSWIQSAQWGSIVNGTISSGSVPQDIWFSTSGGANDTNPYANNHIRMLISSSGNVGIGTTTLYSKLSVWGTNTTNTRVFEVTNFASSTAFAITNSGHEIASTTAPSLSSCGTSPSINGTDRYGTVNIGATGTGCTVTYATAYTNAPSCVVSSQGGIVMTYSMTNTALTLVGATLGGTSIDYRCGALGGE